MPFHKSQVRSLTSDVKLCCVRLRDLLTVVVSSLAGRSMSQQVCCRLAQVSMILTMEKYVQVYERKVVHLGNYNNSKDEQSWSIAAG